MAVINEVIEVLESLLQLNNNRLVTNSPLIGAIPEFDSMAVVSLIAMLEERFGFVVDDDEIDASVFETVGSLVVFVEGKLYQLDK